MAARRGPHRVRAVYHGAIVKVESGQCPTTGLPTCRAIVPWWPQPRDWLDDESNPWHAIDAPQGLKGLYAFEVSGASDHGSLSATVHVTDSSPSPRISAGRNDGETRGGPEVSAAKLERQLKHVNKMLVDKEAKMLRQKEKEDIPVGATAAATAAATTAGVITALIIMRPNTGAPNMTTAGATTIRNVVGSSARISVPSAAVGRQVPRQGAPFGKVRVGGRKEGQVRHAHFARPCLFLVLMDP